MECRVELVIVGIPVHMRDAVLRSWLVIVTNKVLEFYKYLYEIF
jgi:hypothetical protein